MQEKAEMPQVFSRCFGIDRSIIEGDFLATYEVNSKQNSSN